MPILNYTTQISSNKTVSQIQEILAKAGAVNVSIDYGPEGKPIAITFLVNVSMVMINFRLPSNHQGIFDILYEDPKVPLRLKTIDQAQRVAWRILKNWIEAQLAIINSTKLVISNC